MKILAPLCSLLILTLAVNASAVKAPETVVGDGGCIAIIPCDQDTANIGMKMHAKLQSSDIWGKGGLGLRMVPLSDANGMKNGSVGTMIYGTKTQGAEFSDDDPFECKNTLLIELWTPSCGGMPKICTAGNGKNIVELPDEYLPGVNAAPVHQYFFQDLDEKGISTGAFFKGAGFYMSCGGDENRGWDGALLPREKVLIAGGTPAILEDVAMEFTEEAVKSRAEYSPEVKYRTTDDWGQSMIVGFEGNLDAMTALKDKIKDKYGRTPIVVTEGEGMGDLAQVLLNVDSRLYVVTSANTAHVRLLRRGTDNLAYQLFANLNSKEYTDETFVLVDIYGCGQEETFGTTDRFKIGQTVAVKKGENLYIGENGAVCYFEVKDKGGCEALLIGEDEYKKGKGVYCEWAENGSLKGNKYQTGVYSKKSVDGGGELRLMAGLGDCSTNEAVAEYKELSGAFDSGDRQWLPLCNDSKRFPKNKDGSMNCPYGETGYKANGYGGGVFSRAKYCACAVIVEKDMKIMTGRFTQEAYEAGLGVETGPVRLMAGIAMISNEGVASGFADMESGSSVTIDGPKLRVVPFAIDETLRRSYPLEVKLTYGDQSQVWKSGYADFDLDDGGTLRMESEGYPAFEATIIKGKGGLVAAIATISGDLVGDPVEVESGAEYEIKGTGFRVRPFAIDARNLRVIPPEVTLTYKSLSQEQTKTSMNGKPVDFEIYFGGTLTMKSEGYPDYSVKLEPPLAGLLIYHPNKNAWIDVTETTATISWGISKADPGTTSKIHYAFMPDSPDREGALRGGLEWKTETASLENGVWSVTLEGLLPDSEYLFWLDSNSQGYKEMFFPLTDEDNVGEWTFRTKEGKLMITGGPRLVETEKGGATIEWSTSKEVDSMEVTYWYANIPSASVSKIQAEKVSGESWKARFTGITPGVSYKYTIAGSGSILPVANADGETSWDLKLRGLELKAAVSTVSDLGEGDAVEVEDGYSVTVDGVGFKVYPFSIDPSDVNYREHPDVQVTYMGTAERKQSKRGVPVEFSLSKDGLLVLESPGFEPYTIIIRKAESVPASVVERQGDRIRANSGQSTVRLLDAEDLDGAARIFVDGRGTVEIKVGREEIPQIVTIDYDVSGEFIGMNDLREVVLYGVKRGAVSGGPAIEWLPAPEEKAPPAERWVIGTHSESGGAIRLYGWDGRRGMLTYTDPATSISRTVEVTSGKEFISALERITITEENIADAELVGHELIVAGGGR